MLDISKNMIIFFFAWIFLLCESYKKDKYYGIETIFFIEMWFPSGFLLKPEVWA